MKENFLNKRFCKKTAVFQCEFPKLYWQYMGTVKKEEQFPAMFSKKLFLKIKKGCRKSPTLESLFDKVTDCRSATILKRDCDTGLFVGNLQNSE